MKIELIENTKTILSLPVQNKRCSDFDNGCLAFTKEQAFTCWIGGQRFIENISKWVYTEQADGYCPIIHND